jgi:hypothetical protein
MALFKRRSSVKAIFEVKIDFADRKQYGELQKGGSYYFPRFSNQEKKTSYEEIKGYLTDIVEDDLKKHLSKAVGMQIKDIRVTADYDGSIELVFVVLFNVFQFVAGMKDFYDNVRLIRNHSRKYIARRLDDKYGSVFNVSTDIDYPNVDRYDELFSMFRHGEFPFPIHSSNGNISRDGFFYYLLFSNIVLLVVIGFFIFNAVKSYYGF